MLTERQTDRPWQNNHSHTTNRILSCLPFVLICYNNATTKSASVRGSSSTKNCFYFYNYIVKCLNISKKLNRGGAFVNIHHSLKKHLCSVLTTKETQLSGNLKKKRKIKPLNFTRGHKPTTRRRGVPRGTCLIDAESLAVIKGLTNCKEPIELQRRQSKCDCSPGLNLSVRPSTAKPSQTLK